MKVTFPQVRLNDRLNLPHQEPEAAIKVVMINVAMRWVRVRNEHTGEVIQLTEDEFNERGYEPISERRRK